MQSLTDGDAWRTSAAFLSAEKEGREKKFAFLSAACTSYLYIYAVYTNERSVLASLYLEKKIAGEIADEI